MRFLPSFPVVGTYGVVVWIGWRPDIEIQTARHAFRPHTIQPWVSPQQWQCMRQLFFLGYDWVRRYHNASTPQCILPATSLLAVHGCLFLTWLLRRPGPAHGNCTTECQQPREYLVCAHHINHDFASRGCYAPTTASWYQSRWESGWD